MKEDISIFSDASPKRSDSIYNQINAPHYRDFLNDITFGEGDSWFDKQNTTTILPFLEKKVEQFEPPKHPSFKSSRVQKRQPVKKFVPKLTVPRPFKFHAINRINKTENQLSTSPYIPLAARVKQFLEKTPDRFKPKLVSIKPLPPARTIPTTKSKPFKLETDARGEKYKQNLHQELTKMKRRDKENHIFHAKPAPKFPTTQVKKPSKPPTVPVSFVFQTDTRMKERKAFDQQRKLRDQMKNLHREKKRDVRHM